MLNARVLSILALLSFCTVNAQEPNLDELTRRLEAKKKAHAEQQAAEKNAASQREQLNKSRFLTSLGIEFVKIPGGSFEMGSEFGEDDEMPVHTVHIKPFKLSKYEITRDAFATFITETGYRTDAEKNAADSKGCYVYFGESNQGYKDYKDGYNWSEPGFSQTEKHPVVCVSYNDTKKFIAWLKQKTGQTFRLPTEAEWEYAARAGSLSRYSFGDSANELCRYGNGGDRSMKQRFPDPPDEKIVPCDDRFATTAPVGSFLANSFGLHDMHGNVWEWVQDCWHDNYNGAPTNGSAWESDNCAKRALRGGSWNLNPLRLRSSGRDWYSPASRSYTNGFRLAQDL